MAAVAIAQLGRLAEGRRYYVAASAVDGLDGDVERGATVDHDPADGALRLVELVLAQLSIEELEQLADPVREAEQRRAALPC